MTREDVSGIFENATKEQITQILNLNSADIGSAKKKLQTDLDTVNSALSEARASIQALEAAKGDTEKLQKELDDYKAADIKRKQEAEEAERLQALTERFDKVAGEKKFIHEYVRRGVMDDFRKALEDKSNTGRGDVEIFAELTKDKDYFASQNPAGGNMAGINGNIGGSDIDKLDDADYYKAVFKK